MGASVGCQLVGVVKGGGRVFATPDPARIVDTAHPSSAAHDWQACIAVCVLVVHAVPFHSQSRDRFDPTTPKSQSRNHHPDPHLSLLLFFPTPPPNSNSPWLKLRMLESSTDTMVKSFLTKHVDWGLVGEEPPASMTAAAAAVAAALLLRPPPRAGGSISC